MKMLCYKNTSMNDFYKLQASLWNLHGFRQPHQNCGVYEIPLFFTNLKVNLCTHQSFSRNVCLTDTFQDKSCGLRNEHAHRWRSKLEHRHVAFAIVCPLSKLSSAQNRLKNMQSHDLDSSSNFRCEKRTHDSGNVIMNQVIQRVKNNYNAQLYSRGRIFSRPSNPIGLRCLSTSSQTASVNGTNFPVYLRSWRKEKRSILIHFQIMLSDERLYSKHRGNRDDDKIDDFGDVLKDMHSQKNTFKADPNLKADPDLKAILDEIKNDFHDSPSVKNISSGSSSDSDSSSSSSSDDESASKDQNVNSSNLTMTALQEEEYIYDYRYADDIEDFGFEEDGQVQEERPAKIVPIPLTRGCNGVFDLDELLTFLDHLGLENVVTIDVPPEANYCDHMVIGSAKSARHLQYINDEFLWIHKRKKGAKDPHLLIEGVNRSDWCAMDLGNIVLHVFYGDFREYYDIESLWTLGPNLDPKCQEQAHDPLALSDEQLFWMESSKMKEEETKTEVALKAQHQDKPSESMTNNNNRPNLSDPTLQQEAGWNNPPKSKS